MKVVVFGEVTSRGERLLEAMPALRGDFDALADRIEARLAGRATREGAA